MTLLKPGQIFQRQVTKTGLSDQLIDQAQNTKGNSDGKPPYIFL